MKLALFDLDNTLLAGDSDFEWAQFLIGKGVLDREVHEARNLAFFEQYKAGTLDIHAFLDFQLAPLARHARAELDAWHREFLATRIRPLISPAARKLVRQAHRGRRPAGHRHRHQQLRHRPDRPRVRHPAPDRHHPGAGERPLHRASRAAPPRSAKARSSASTPGSNRSASGWAASNRAGSTAIRTTTCRCWKRSRIRSQSMPMPR
jgi:hypothetical protein